jgi:hypothetical protein
MDEVNVLEEMVLWDGRIWKSSCECKDGLLEAILWHLSDNFTVEFRRKMQDMRV